MRTCIMDSWHHPQPTDIRMQLHMHMYVYMYVYVLIMLGTLICTYESFLDVNDDNEKDCYKHDDDKAFLFTGPLANFGKSESENIKFL